MFLTMAEVSWLLEVWVNRTRIVLISKMERQWGDPKMILKVFNLSKARQEAVGQLPPISKTQGVRHSTVSITFHKLLNQVFMTLTERWRVSTRMYWDSWSNIHKCSEKELLSWSMRFSDRMRDICFRSRDSNKKRWEMSCCKSERFSKTNTFVWKWWRTRSTSLTGKK